MNKMLVGLYMAMTATAVHAQQLIPFEFTSEDDNRLIKENDSLKFYVASDDSSNTVALNEDDAYYRLIDKNDKVLAQGPYVLEGEKFLQDGKWTTYWGTGKPRRAGYFRRNLPIGTWKEYYSNGKLKTITNYALIANEHGDLFSCPAGAYEEYFENGKLKTMGFFSAAMSKKPDTVYITDPVSGRDVVKYIDHSVFAPEKTGHWEYYTEDGELDKKEDF